MAATALEMSSSMEDEERAEVCEYTAGKLAEKREEHHESGEKAEKADLKITLTRSSVPC